MADFDVNFDVPEFKMPGHGFIGGNDEDIKRRQKEYDEQQAKIAEEKEAKRRATGPLERTKPGPLETRDKGPLERKVRTIEETSKEFVEATKRRREFLQPKPEEPKKEIEKPKEEEKKIEEPKFEVPELKIDTQYEVDKTPFKGEKVDAEALGKYTEQVIKKTSEEVAKEVSARLIQDYPTRAEVNAMPKVPPDLEDVGAVETIGDVIVRGANGKATWGTLPKDEADMDYSDFAFGFSCSEDVVTVNGGYLFHGTLDAIAVAGDDITITDDATYIFVTYTIGSGVATLSSSTTLPRDEENIIKWLLYKVTLSDEIASIDEGNIHHLGSIKIPSVYASDV